MTQYAIKLTEDQRRELLAILDREEERTENVIAFRVSRIRQAVDNAAKYEVATGEKVQP